MNPEPKPVKSETQTFADLEARHARLVKRHEELRRELADLMSDIMEARAARSDERARWRARGVS